VSRAAIRARRWSPEQAQKNVELWHSISGADETLRRMAHDDKSALAWREIERNLLRLRHLATGRGEKWSYAYQAKRAAERAAYYEARVETARKLLSGEQVTALDA
jgi:hypothetical protein